MSVKEETDAQRRTREEEERENEEIKEVVMASLCVDSVSEVGLGMGTGGALISPRFDMQSGDGTEIPGLMLMMEAQAQLRLKRSREGDLGLAGDVLDNVRGLVITEEEQAPVGATGGVGDEPPSSSVLNLASLVKANKKMKKDGEKKLSSNPRYEKWAPRIWTEKEDELLREGVRLFGEGHWKAISAHIGTKTNRQCLQRFKRLDITIGRFTSEENDMLRKLVGEQLFLAPAERPDWELIQKQLVNYGFGNRSPRQLQDHWKVLHACKLKFTPEEDLVILSKGEFKSVSLKGRTYDQIRTRYRFLTRCTRCQDLSSDGSASSPDA